MWFITWDPTQPVATRPLSIQTNSTWYTYGWDSTKNICELFSSEGTISSAYTYSPFGKVSTNYENVSQPIQWSSEFWDSEVGLVYYNWRFFNPLFCQWISRDPLGCFDSFNEYTFLHNSRSNNDVLGLWTLFGKTVQAGVNISAEGCFYIPTLALNLCLSGEVTVSGTGCCKGGELKGAVKSNLAVVVYGKFGTPNPPFSLNVGFPVSFDLSKPLQDCPRSADMEINQKLFFEASIGFIKGGFEFEYAEEIDKWQYEFYFSGTSTLFDTDDSDSDTDWQKDKRAKKFIQRINDIGISLGGFIEGEGISISNRDEFLE